MFQTRAHVTGDANDRFAMGAYRALLARAGLPGGERNEFSGLGLAELARESLNIRGERAGSMDRMTMIGRAFTIRNAAGGMHSTTDFPSILQNVAYKAMLKGYEEVDENFPLWTAKGSASDFRPQSRVALGLFPSLDLIPEGAEYRYATISDRGTTVQLATYGKKFAVTRQAVINDDMNELAKVPRLMGRAAKRTIGNLVFATLFSNPLMEDGLPVFHANHGNFVQAGSGGVPSVSQIGSMRAAMSRQTDPGLTTSLGVGIQPKFIIVPPELLDITQTVINSTNVPGDPGLTPNPIKGYGLTPISDARLTGNPWYLAADPNVTDTIEVTYLDDQDEPTLDQQAGWDVDGTEFKVRIDAGVKLFGYRGVAKNNGY